MHLVDSDVVLGVQHGFDSCRADRLIAWSQQNKQSRIDSDLTVSGSQLQDLQVFLAALRRTKLLLKQIEGHAEPAGGEQLVAVSVVLERARLTHQPVDDVPIVHAMLLPPA